MSRIEACFEALASRGERALIAFFCGGDPDLSTTRTLLRAVIAGGADLIELGVPYSDPMADGPVIQHASERALAQGTTLRDLLDVVSEVRVDDQTPIILFGYYNPFLQYGLARLADEAQRAGVDGLLVVDLPPEEAKPLHAELSSRGLHLISLLTPTSDRRRVEQVRSLASGFVYYVSMTGVTGGDIHSAAAEVGPRVNQLREELDLPIAVGFGVSTPAQVAAIGASADGVVVGSALIRTVEEARGRGESVSETARAFVSALKAPLREEC